MNYIGVRVYSAFVRASQTAENVDTMLRRVFTADYVDAVAVAHHSVLSRCRCATGLTLSTPTSMSAT